MKTFLLALILLIASGCMQANIHIKPNDTKCKITLILPASTSSTTLLNSEFIISQLSSHPLFNNWTMASRSLPYAEIINLSASSDANEKLEKCIFDTQFTTIDIPYFFDNNELVPYTKKLQEASRLFNCTLTITMPGKITFANMGKVFHHKVKIDLFEYLSNKKNIVITSKKGNRLHMIFIMLFIIISLIILKKCKK